MFDFLVSVFFSAVLFFLGYGQESHVQPSPSPLIVEQAATESARFIRVVDGDTIKLFLQGKEETIRVIGINTPETVDPRKSVECYGKEATEFAKTFFASPSAEIILMRDITQGDQDKYQRLLRYVSVAGVDYGESTIREGYAYEYTYDSPYQKQELYRLLQKKASDEQRGLWSEKACR